MVATNILASGAPAVFTNGRYVFVRRSIRVGQGARSGIVIDEQNGSRSSVSFPSGCFPATIGGPWLAFSCQSPAAELYGLASRQWQPLAANPRLADRCNFSSECSIGPVAIGTRWIQWSWGGGCEHCTASYDFQNLHTGQLGTLPAWQPEGRLIPNLDARRLARKLCHSLRVPLDVGANDRNVGPLTFYGPFVVGQATAPYGYPVTAYVQGCGSSRRYPLSTGGDMPGANQHAVVWRSSSRQILGLSLPSLRRFVIPVPAELGYPAVQVTVSSRHLYALDDTGRLWSSPAPSLVGK